MAGMLPGVEVARRRRFHNSNPNELSPISTSGISSTRRPSFCLYARNHEFHFHSSMRNPIIGQQGLCDESGLGAAAREAKKRLDERLQPQRKTSETKRIQSRTPNESRSTEERSMRQSDHHTQVFMPKLKKSGSKKLNWLKLSWKSAEQEECTVCLEQFKGETLMQLPCGHKFHTNCLVPWLQANAYCPCCRMEIPS